MKPRLQLIYRRALGDTVLMTAVARDIALAYPGKYDIGISSNYTNVWKNNPRIVTTPPPRTQQVTRIEFDTDHEISRHNAPHPPYVHFLAWFHKFVRERHGLNVHVTQPKAELFLTPEESARKYDFPYWVLVNGGKLDATTKHWSPTAMQVVVNELRAMGYHFVQVGATELDNRHFPLEGAVNLIGQTPDARTMMGIVANSEGVICPITSLMHIAPAFDKPCVVLGGGREAWWWEAYVNEGQAFGPQAAPVAVPHRYLHVLGQLDCCADRGCWRDIVTRLAPKDKHADPRKLCLKPVENAVPVPIAKCMTLIEPRHVIEAVLSYRDHKPPAPLLIPKSTPQPAPQRVLHLVSKKASLGMPHALDHATLGGSITVFVLCHGNYPQLARRCLDGILRTVPTDRLDLRVATNGVCPATMEYLKTLPITKVYEGPPERRKYPAMREMFHDPALPIATPYFVWFDDDTWVQQDNWLTSLVTDVVRGHPEGARLYGDIRYHDLAMWQKQNHDPSQWFKRASWWRGIPFRTRGSDRPVSNGTLIEFVVGWFWAMATATMREADIPDTRLSHNGGDICVGVQVKQAGYSARSFNRNKISIACPPKEQGGRRGYQESFPWVNPANVFAGQYVPPR